MSNDRRCVYIMKLRYTVAVELDLFVSALAMLAGPMARLRWCECYKKSTTHDFALACTSMSCLAQFHCARTAVHDRMQLCGCTATCALLVQIPEQPWFLWSCFTIAVGGILPYGAVFIEMFFILQSLWMGNYYYVFGFLLLVFIILIVTCADIAMVFCYFQLCAEDYHWSVAGLLPEGGGGGATHVLRGILGVR